MAKTKPKIEVADFIRRLFPDDKERELLVSFALNKLSAEGKTTKRGKFHVDVAIVVMEMLRLQRVRSLVQLLVAIEPQRANGVGSLLGDIYTLSSAELAYVFGVGEPTIQNDWIPKGMP